jgi:hypothetical protein
MTSLTYTSVTPVKECFWSNDGEETRFQMRGSWWRGKVNIKFICTSFRNRQNSEPLASFSGLFRSEYKWILYLTTMYVFCVYPHMIWNISILNIKGKINKIAINIFILQSVHLLYKYAIRINFCFFRTRTHVVLSCFLIWRYNDVTLPNSW